MKLLVALSMLLSGSLSAQATDAMPLREGAYLPSSQHCADLRNGELDMVEFAVTEEGRAFGFPEAGCVIASIKQLRPNRYAVESDCMEAGENWQHSMMLDVLKSGDIRIDGRELMYCNVAAVVEQPNTRPRSPDQLVEEWYDADEGCRGGSGDDSATDKTCQSRDAIGAELAALSWCYGKKRQSGSQRQWHRCGKDSIRP